MEEYKDSPTALVADVDCTAEGKDLCNQVGVKGYPTIKYGDPSDLQDYNGGRDLNSLKKFAAENLKPMCGVKNLDLCDADKKAQIEGYMAMDVSALDATIAAEEKKLQDAEETFKTELAKLQATYERLMKEKETTEANVKAAGLSMMKSVKGVKAKGGNDEL